MAMDQSQSFLEVIAGCPILRAFAKGGITGAPSIAHSASRGGGGMNFEDGAFELL